MTQRTPPVLLESEDAAADSRSSVAHMDEPVLRADPRHRVPMPQPGKAPILPAAVASEGRT